jgi:hypothetical protein
MPLPITEINVLRDYMRGVLDRADHHAGSVNEIALALVGAIIWRKDDNVQIEVMTQGGEMKNVLWVHIGGQGYAFSYNHSIGCIEMRQGTTHGESIHAFSNATSLGDLKRTFENL